MSREVRMGLERVRMGFNVIKIHHIKLKELTNFNFFKKEILLCRPLEYLGP